MGTPYARSRTRRVRVAATIVGAELTGQFTLQPAVKALAAVLLAVAALTDPISRERRRLVSAGLFFGRASVPSATPSA
jgi:uncharacterized membrane protein YhhN